MNKSVQEKEREMAKKKTSKKVEVERFSTGSTVLDCILSDGRGTAGGYPIKMMRLNSHSKAGKTRLALEAIYQILAQYGPENVEILYIDAERGMSIDTEECYGFTLDVGETLDITTKTLDMMQVAVAEFCKNRDKKKVGIIVVDSLDALPDAKALENLDERTKQLKKDGDVKTIKSYGMTKAKLMSEVLSTVNALAADSRTHLLAIQQVRTNVNASMFEKDTTTSGGNAPGFYTSVTLELKRKTSFGIKNRESGYILEVFGEKTRTKYEKRKAYIAVNHTMGFDKVKSDLIFLYDLMTDKAQFDEPKSRALKWEPEWDASQSCEKVESVTASEYKEFALENEYDIIIREEYGSFNNKNTKTFIQEDAEALAKFIETFGVMDLDTLCSYIEEHDLEEELSNRVKDKFYTIEEALQPKNRKSRKLI